MNASFHIPINRKVCSADDIIIGSLIYFPKILKSNKFPNALGCLCIIRDCFQALICIKLNLRRLLVLDWLNLLPPLHQTSRNSTWCQFTGNVNFKENQLLVRSPFLPQHFHKILSFLSWHPCCWTVANTPFSTSLTILVQNFLLVPFRISLWTFQ